MSNPNIPSGFKPTPSLNASATKGLATSRAADGTSLKQNSNTTDSAGNIYNVKRFMFPEDLETSMEYGRQNAIFFINVAVSGNQTAGNLANSDQTLYDIPPEDLSKFSGQKLAAAGEGTVNSIATTAAGVPAVVVAAKMKRLDTAISLHMPNNLATSYSVDWGEASDEDMRGKDFLLTSAIKAASAISGNGKTGSAWQDLKDAGRQIATTAGTNAIINAVGVYGQKSARVTGGNAKAEQIFNGVGFREFTYNYTFKPKSLTEAQNVLNIIRMFRYHMLPEFADPLSFMYIYPSEFNIKFYSNGKENQYIEKVSTCVLKNVTVDYTPDGQFNTFVPDDNGAMPTTINVTLNFQELSKVSKETSPWFGQGL